MMVWEP